MRFLILVGLVAGIYSCSGGWRRIEDLTPRALPQRTQVQVWQDRRVTLLHGVRLEPDRLDGVPYHQPPTCDSCRVRLPLTDVDSLRTGNKERGFYRSAGLVVGIALAMAIVFQGVGGE